MYEIAFRHSESDGYFNPSAIERPAAHKTSFWTARSIRTGTKKVSVLSGTNMGQKDEVRQELRCRQPESTGSLFKGILYPSLQASQWPVRWPIQRAMQQATSEILNLQSAIHRRPEINRGMGHQASSTKHSEANRFNGL